MPNLIPSTCVISFDTTWFGKLGISVSRDIIDKENLLWVFVEKEKQDPYDYMYNKIKEQGFTILGIVVDGRKSFYTSFNNTPIQMGHFHMAKILSRYLTKNPNLQVNIDLWNIWYKVNTLTPYQLNKELFNWYRIYAHKLVEEYIDPRDNRWRYTKERTLKAYHFIKRFVQYLFTYRDSRWIPNTNISTEGMFSQMKRKIKIHNELILERKMKIIHYYLRKNGAK